MSHHAQTPHAQTPPAKTQGAHHVGLNVPDLERAVAFFTEALGFSLIGRKPAYPAAFVRDAGVMITLWQAPEADRAIPFDRTRNLGMHHLALQVADGVSLDELHRDLAAREGVAIEFAPEDLGDGPTRHMMFAIEGNIRLELIAPAAKGAS